MSGEIQYSKRLYKYRLKRTYVHHLEFDLPPIVGPGAVFHADGRLLTIEPGYAWDGPSGLTIDTKTFMRGSLVHDVLYQAMREQLLVLDWRLLADQELKRVCLIDGMSSFRAAYVYRCVRLFGEKHCKPRRVEVETAP